MFAVILALNMAAPPSLNGDPFAFFQPSVSISRAERQQLDRGQPIARVLPGHDLEVAVFAAVPVEVDGDRLVAWMRRVEQLKKSSYVLAIKRFSNPPRLDDLADLSLDDEDLADIRACHPGDCNLKLSAEEMADLRRAAASGSDWKSAVQQAFRRVVFARVQAYMAEGNIASYNDEKSVVWPAMRFATLLDHSVFLSKHMPAFATYLRGYPQTASPQIESFFYWSKEKLARKPIVSVTHVSILRADAPGLPDALVAGKEIFSTHYINASLGLTAILRGAPGGCNYLAYINRSEVDTLGGTFGGLIRYFMQRRLQSEAATVLSGLRHRLEGGEPQP